MTTDKPHLRKMLGLWYCGLTSEYRSAWFVGYTPAHAYQAWRESR